MIINNLNVLGQVHTDMQSACLVQSKADFSTRYLGIGESYLSSMQARGRQVPNAVIALLEWNIQREMVSFRANPHWGVTYAPRLNAAYECLDAMIHVVRRHRARIKQFETLGCANDNIPNRWPPFGPAVMAQHVESPQADKRSGEM